MNPNTKVTARQLKAISSKHHISYVSHERITTGFSHEVHRLNDDLVIKIYNAHDANDFQKFKTESALLGSSLPFRKPKLIASGQKDVNFDRNYIIMSYVPGVSLGSVWHEAPDDRREELIKTISQSLRVINRAKPVDLSLEASASWDVLTQKRGELLNTELLNKGTITQAKFDAVLRTLANNTQFLAGSTLLPVYWDIHFDNFIVNDTFELQAIIDLENVELTPLDYPLFVIQKMTDEPEKYLSKENEKFANKQDYANLKYWYQKYYPEMFAFDKLDARVKIYQLLDTLHLLRGWPQVKSLYVKLDRLTS